MRIIYFIEFGLIVVIWCRRENRSYLTDVLIVSLDTHVSVMHKIDLVGEILSEILDYA